eukprot:5861384-Amphidinium_carterae.1
MQPQLSETKTLCCSSIDKTALPRTQAIRLSHNEIDMVNFFKCVVGDTDTSKAYRCHRHVADLQGNISAVCLR